MEVKKLLIHGMVPSLTPDKSQPQAAHELERPEISAIELIQ